MNQEQAWNVLVQIVNQTRALPQEVDIMRQALEMLRPKVANVREAEVQKLQES